MSKPYETRILSLIVLPKGDDIFSEQATTIKIEDEAGGEFIAIEQSGLVDSGKISIDPMEWPAIRAAIDRMIVDCRPLHPTDQ